MWVVAYLNPIKNLKKLNKNQNQNMEAISKWDI